MDVELSPGAATAVSGQPSGPMQDGRVGTTSCAFTALRKAALCCHAPAMELSWTRDPFDRLIVANAITDGVRLLTVDENIQKHFQNAFWG